ncbi:uncharacterized protein LOC142587336 isoform X5 [Dermacentor variabilis]|uniref:uncharacterized protein LOC142587336 isoform X5 n=1 Tax=Dermacentor variabilis TaxID=34621 RepID=UPI003F5BE7CD
MQFSGDPLEVDPYLCCGRFQTQDLFMQQVLLGCICNASSRRECFGHVAICIHSHPGTTAMRKTISLFPCIQIGAPKIKLPPSQVEK